MAAGSQHTALTAQVVALPSPMDKKRKGIRLRKLYSLGEDVMAGANLGGSAAPVQAAGVIATGSQGRWRRISGGGGRTSGGGCLSQSPPAASEVAALCPCWIRRA